MLVQHNADVILLSSKNSVLVNGSQSRNNDGTRVPGRSCWAGRLNCRGYPMFLLESSPCRRAGRTFAAFEVARGTQKRVCANELNGNQLRIKGRGEDVED